MIDITSYIPDHVKERMVESLVEFLASQADQLGKDGVADHIRQLSTQSDYHQAVDQAIDRGFERFVAEYTARDEDLVAAISDNTALWRSSEVEQVLAEMISRPGAWMVEERESIARHFETVLPKRVNRQRVDEAVLFLLRCIAEELWTLPGAKEVREVYGLQFQRVTAEAAQEQVSLAKQQILATTQLTGELRQALLQLTGAIEQNLLTGHVEPASSSDTLLLSNLRRPHYIRYVGRELELDWLREQLPNHESASPIAITGIGGVGKSALALTIAHEFRKQYEQLAPESRFDAIIWISAKEEQLTALGLEPADLPENVFHTIEDVYTQIARTLERTDITKALPSEQSHLVKKALARQRTLLILDNLESVTDERIVPFLSSLPETVTVLVTSRAWFDTPHTLSLSGLHWEVADTLIDDEARVRDVSLNNAEKESLFDYTKGLPLPIKLSVARMASGETYASVIHWLGDATGELPEYCIKGQVDLACARNKDAQAILLACSLFDSESGASRQALGEITALTAVDRDRAIAQLQRLFLIDRGETDRFWMLPIVQRYVGAVLAVSPNRVGLIQDWIDWMGCFASGRGANLEWNAKHVVSISSEFSNLLKAVRLCREEQRWTDAYALAEGIWNYAYLIGLFNEMQEVLETAMEAANELADEAKVGRVELHLGKLAGVRGQHALALAHLDIAEKLAEKYSNFHDLGVAWATRSAIFFFDGQIVDGENVATSLFDLAEREDDLYLKIQAASRFTMAAWHRDAFDEALEWTVRAEEWACQLGSPRKLASVLYARGLTLLFIREYQASASTLREAKRLSQECGEDRVIALCSYRLGMAHSLMGLQMLTSTSDHFERLGMQRDLEKLTTFQELIKQGSDKVDIKLL